MGFFNLGQQPTEQGQTQAQDMHNASNDAPVTAPGGVADMDTSTNQTPSPTNATPTPDKSLTDAIAELMDTVQKQSETIERQQEQMRQQQADFNRQLADFVQHGKVSTAGNGADASAETQPIQQQPEASGYVPLRELNVADSYIRRGRN